jgi:hypothetical protein
MVWLPRLGEEFKQALGCPLSGAVRPAALRPFADLRSVLRITVRFANNMPVFGTKPPVRAATCGSVLEISMPKN